VLLVGEIRRLHCKSCDAVVTEAVPWARHGSDFTIPFEDAVALLAQRTNQSAVAELTGIAWKTVGNIARRVVAERLDPSRMNGLRRIAVDEISFLRRHNYLTVVTDHDTRRVVWVAEGKSSEVLANFFKLIGAEACQRIEIVTMDMSAAFIKAVKEHLPKAEIAFDHFHIARLANEALHEVRRSLVRVAEPEDKASIKNTLWALLYRMDNAPEKQQSALAQLRPEQPLGRAYLLKESLLDVLSGKAPLAEQSLLGWLGWASRSRLTPFIKLSRTLRDHLAGIRTLLKQRFTNGLAEGMNNKIRMVSHRAFGFHSADALISMIYLCCSGIMLPNLQLV
jgi:transposase